MRTFIIGLVSILLISIESTLLKGIQIRNITPNIILIFVVTYGILRGSKAGGKVGLFVGLVQDVLFFDVVGFYALIYFYMGFLAGYFNKDFYKENYVLPLVLIAAADILFGFTVYILTYLFRGRLNISYYIYNIILPEMVYTMVISLFIYKLICVLNNRIIKFEKRFNRFS